MGLCICPEWDWNLGLRLNYKAVALTTQPLRQLLMSHVFGFRVVVAVENVNTHKPEWFPEPVPNETVEIEEELEETDFVVLKVNARDQDVGSDNSRIG